MNHLPFNIVVFSSEQLWPSINGIKYFSKYFPALFQELFILATDDENKSIRPAKRLKDFCALECEGLKVNLKRGIGMTTQAIDQCLQGLISKEPDIHWIINVTGGTKLMTLGAARHLNNPNVSFIYRDMTSESWVKIENQEGMLNSRNLDISTGITDEISIRNLLQTMLDKPEGTSLSTEKPIMNYDLRDLTSDLIETDWDWQVCFKKINPAFEKISSGRLFEQFVGLCLWGMGIKKIALNLEIKSGGAAQQSLEEFDICLSHNGSMTLIDCKLRNDPEQAILDQIRKAGEQRRVFGGLNSTILLLRPSLEFSDEQIELMKVRNITFMDRRNNVNFFSDLAEKVNLGCDLPEEVEHSESITREALERRKILDMFQSPISYIEKFRDEKEPDLKVLLSCDSEISKYKKRFQQNWAIFRISSGFIMHLTKTEGEVQDVGQVSKKLGLTSNFIRLKKGPKSLLLYCDLPHGLKGQEIDQRLMEFVGQDLYILD